MLLEKHKELMKRILDCCKCKENGFGDLIKYYPVYSFGNPLNKDILAIGSSPSQIEYEGKYLLETEDTEKRKENQLLYFWKEYYDFFKDFEVFFNDKSKKIKELTNLCSTFLVQQLKLFKPKIVIAYGKSLIEFISMFYNCSSIEFSNVSVNNDLKILNIPQTRIGVHGYNYFQIKLIKTSIEIMLRKYKNESDESITILEEKKEELYRTYLKTQGIEIVGS